MLKPFVVNNLEHDTLRLKYYRHAEHYKAAWQRLTIVESKYANLAKPQEIARTVLLHVSAKLYFGNNIHIMGLCSDGCDFK